jgi:Zn-dependent protease
LVEQLSTVQQFTVWILPVLFAITLHEVAHGWMARCLGDPTAFILGRLSLNPLKHIDPLGTIVVPLLCFFAGGLMFGWAKSVPVNFSNLKNPRRDMAWVALAGPLSNGLMMIGWALLTKVVLLTMDSSVSPAVFLLHMGQAGMIINALLMVLNLLPIPPLDGSRIFIRFLPRSMVVLFDAIEPYGFIIIFILLSTRVLSVLLDPLLHGVLLGLSIIFGF